jgi:hypothetical protein
MSNDSLYVTGIAFRRSAPLLNIPEAMGSNSNQETDSPE